MESLNPDIGNSESNLKTVNILIVDDRPENLLAMGEVLNSPEYNIVQANSGEEALRHLLAIDFAVILLDVQMPDMDGFETAAWIRKRARSKNTPIIFVTAVGKSDEYIKKGYDLGAVDYLLKPVVPDFLKTKVAVFVELFKKTALLKKDKEHLAQMAEKLAKSNSELEQFAYVASHDLQEPLRKIKSFTELFARKYKGNLDEDADQYIYYITDAAHRMQRLISGLLQYSRISTQGKPFEKADLNTIFKNTLSLIQVKIDESKAIVRADELPELMVDTGQMGRLFQNLILNAIKFNNKKKPEIHISAQLISGYDPEDKGSATEKNKTNIKNQNRENESKKLESGIWKISVRDNGNGIDPDQSERIFNIFQRLNTRDAYPGEGMGLAICKKIVERHGGKIWVESAGKGKGAVFCFTLKD